MSRTTTNAEARDPDRAAVALVADPEDALKKDQGAENDRKVGAENDRKVEAENDRKVEAENDRKVEAENDQKIGPFPGLSDPLRRQNHPRNDRDKINDVFYVEYF